MSLKVTSGLSKSRKKLQSHADVVGVGSLEVALAAPLGANHGSRLAVDPGQAPSHEDLVGSPAEAPHDVASRHPCVAAEQVRERAGLVQAPMDAAHHQGGRGARRAELLLDPSVSPQRAGCHRYLGQRAVCRASGIEVEDLCPFFTRYCAQDPQGRARGKTSGELRCAQDRGLVGNVHEVAGRRGEGRATDPSGVEVVDLEALQEGAPLREEGSSLGIERFSVGQVDDGRVGLHLSEVGIERGVERQVRAETHLQIGARVCLEVERVHERVRRIAVGRDGRAHRGIGKDLDPPSLLDGADSFQRAEP
jgi:hypothetical protein